MEWKEFLRADAVTGFNKLPRSKLRGISPQCVEEMKGILGMDVQPKVKRIKEAFIRTFYKADTGLFVDSSVSSHSSLHANAFACFLGLC